MQQLIDQIVVIGSDHKVTTRQKNQLGNMLRSAVIRYVGFDQLKSGHGEKLDDRKVEAEFKRLVREHADPLFLMRVDDIYTAFCNLEAKKKALEDQLGSLVEQLPVWSWASRQPGCGPVNLGKIIAEAGRNPSDYETPAKLWKRFGHDVTDGVATKRKEGQKLGYSPYRKSVLWDMGECLIRAGGKEEKGNRSYWRRLYDERKEYELRRCKEKGLQVLPAAKINKKNKDTSRSEGLINNRAKRYMRKQFLKALWEEWIELEEVAIAAE